jgi:hypothetical protein
MDNESFSCSTYGDLHISVYHPSRTVTFYFLGAGGTRKGRIEINLASRTFAARAEEAENTFNNLIQGKPLGEHIHDN